MALLRQVGLGRPMTRAEFDENMNEFPNRFATIAALKAATWLQVGQAVAVEEYHAGVGGGILFGRIVAGGTGTDDGGSYIDLAASGLQFEQNFSNKLTPVQFGARGDGVTSDTTVFANLESFITGSKIDLCGKNYLVTSEPTGNDYYNGSFNVSSVTVYKNETQREHPLANPVLHARAILPADGKYRGLSTAAFHREGSNTIAIVYREALGHGSENNIPIYCRLSDDIGNRFNTGTSGDNESFVIAQQSDADIRNWASGVMASGRFGILAARYDNDLDTYSDPLFLYSDDDGVTWNTSSVSFTTASWDSHSRIYPYPASVGGHDTNGFICYSYTTDHGICAMKTVDNGATWTEVLDCLLPTSLDPLSEAPNLSEMSVARVGNENKWVMVVRTNQEAAVSVSTNMTAWTPAKLIPTSVMNKLLANPPELTYADGKLWFWAFSRRGSKEIYQDNANALLVSSGNAKDIFAANGLSGWGQWRVVSNLPFWPSGYMNHFTVRGKPYALCTTGEDTAGSTTSRQAVMTLLGPDAPVVTDPRSVMQMIPKPNLYPNGDFKYFPIAETFASTTSRVHVAPLVSFARNSGASGATLSRMDGDRSKYKIRIQRDDGNSATNEINLILPFDVDDSFMFRREYITVSIRARCGAGFSASNNKLIVRMRQTTDDSGAEITSLSGGFPVGDSTVQSSSTGITLTETFDDYNIVIGPFDFDINRVMLQIRWTPTGTAADDFIEFEDLKLEFGKLATPFEQKQLSENLDWCERYMQVFDYPVINGTQYIKINKMKKSPAAVSSLGTVISSGESYVEVSHTASGVSSITAIAKT